MVEKRLEGKRLSYYFRRADRTFWSENWEEISIEKAVMGAKQDRILGRIFSEYLPRRGKILDAGCGLGHWVKVLRDRGFDVAGIDFSKETIGRARKYDITLPVMVGNVLSLPFCDDSFAGYISLGVVEHFEEGPEMALREANRILKRDGKLVVSVPFINPLRRLKCALGCYSKISSFQTNDFYQHAFRKSDFVTILEACGFDVLRTMPFDGIKGILDEIPRLDRLGATLRRRIMGRKPSIRARDVFLLTTLKTTSSLKLVRELAGHMMLYIAKAR